MMPPDSVVSVDPEVMGGKPVFAGTRVPVQMLIDYLDDGDGLEEFLLGFPTVSRQQAEQFLRESGRPTKKRNTGHR
jgi:uncharacterized protein (DUF433 family)